MDQINQPVDAGTEVVAQPQEIEAPVVEQEIEQPVQEKAPQSQEENAKYAAARREAEKEANALKEKIKRLESLAQKGGFENVDSFAESYERQLTEVEEQRRREELEDQGIDPDIYEQMLQDDPRIKKYNEIENQKKVETQNQKNINEFLDYFETTNGRPYDGRVDTLPDEVEKLAQSGIPLVIAYQASERTKLKAELESLKAQIDASKTNERNSASSTGSIDPGAPNDGGFISKEVFDSNKSNQKWVIQNLEKLTQSRKKW